MDYKDLIIKLLKKETKLKEIPIEEPKDPSLGDFAFPCFILSSTLKKSPVDIATELAETLKLPKGVTKVEAKGPYLNFYIEKADYVKDVIHEVLKQKEKYGQSKNTKKTYMVEFFHANPYKAVHIGHIRNICLGAALSNIMEFAGNKIIRSNYQGDVGTHVIKCLWGLKGKKIPTKDRLNFYGKVYIEANKKIKDNDKLEKEIKELSKKFYAGDKDLLKKWKETREHCLDEFEDFYKEFGVKFNRLYFESEVEKLGVEISKELVKKKIAKVDQGATIIDFKDEVLRVVVLVTQEGYALYSAKDLGLAQLKIKEFPKLTQSINLVGKEQELHFKQVYKMYEIMGIDKKLPSKHLIYELVMLPEGKMSSREGNVILFPELKEKLFSKSLEEVKKRHKDWKAAEQSKSATNIAWAALKFGMLTRENNKVLLFDWDKALDFEGETGPYVQYAHARICSILKKYGKKVNTKADLSYLGEEDEVRLIKLIEEFPNVILNASISSKVHSVSHYLLELARTFNEFYHSKQILKEDDNFRDARLVLITAVQQVLENGLGLLGIVAPERM